MREISSKDNKIFRLCEQLTHKKYRDKLGLYLIEGENLLEEAVKNGAGIKTVLMCRDYRGSLFGTEDKSFCLSDKLFEQLDRLTNKNLSGDKLQEELERTDAIVDISRTIISNADLMLKAMVAKDEKLGSYAKLPALLDGNE